MKICLVTKPGHSDSGIGRYSAELGSALEKAGLEVVVTHPTVPLPRWLLWMVRRLFGWDAQAFLENYPLWTHYPPADIYHISSQNLATLMIFCRPPGLAVVTVHDIIPWETRHDPEIMPYRSNLHRLFDKLALVGITRAQWLISDSNSTALSILRAIPHLDGKIQNIYLGIN